VRSHFHRFQFLLSPHADDNFETGLREGVAQIVRTFSDKLLAFKFLPRTARKLQGFQEFH